MLNNIGTSIVGLNSTSLPAREDGEGDLNRFQISSKGVLYIRTFLVSQEITQEFA